jgi:hypothetical protein
MEIAGVGIEAMGVLDYVVQSAAAGEEHVAERARIAIMRLIGQQANAYGQMAILKGSVAIAEGMIPSGVGMIAGGVALMALGTGLGAAATAESAALSRMEQSERQTGSQSAAPSYGGGGGVGTAGGGSGATTVIYNYHFSGALFGDDAARTAHKLAQRGARLAR